MVINRINVFAELRDVFTDGRMTIKTPKQGIQNMPKKNPNTNCVVLTNQFPKQAKIRDTSFKLDGSKQVPNKGQDIESIAVEAMSNSIDEHLTNQDVKSVKEANKANEKRRKKLDKVSRKIAEVKTASKINDKDKAYYGKKLNKCMKKSAKLEAELTELLKQEQLLQ